MAKQSTYCRVVLNVVLSLAEQFLNSRVMSIDDEINVLQQRRANLRFTHLVRICTEFFGAPRVRGSHHIFKTPWPGDPRINLQEQRGRAKPYQVDQVIYALQKLMDADPSGAKRKGTEER